MIDVTDLERFFLKDFDNNIIGFLGWWHGSNGRVPAYQAQGPELNP
jgi:hypothetical protein